MKDVGGFAFLCIPAYRVSGGLLKSRTVSSSQVYEVVFATEAHLDSTMVLRRYSEFRRFRDFVDVSDLPPFPKKRLLVNSQHREERRSMLQSWLWGVLEEPCLQSALCAFLSTPFNPYPSHPSPGDLLAFEVVTRLHAQPNKKLSALKDFDTQYFEGQPNIAPARAQVLLRHLAGLCCEQLVSTFAVHLLTKLLCRRTNRNAGALLEQLHSLPEAALHSMHLEQLSDPVAFELLGVLETELPLLQPTVSPEALHLAWQRPATTVKSQWTPVGCLGMQVEFQWSEGKLEVKVSSEICASSRQVVECFTKPEKRKLWDFALANVSVQPDSSYTFEIDLNGVRESWNSHCSLTPSTTTELTFTGDYSDSTVRISEVRPLLCVDNSDTEEECSPAVTVRIEYTEVMRKGLARLYLKDIEGQLAASWQKFRSVAEGDLSPTVLSASGMRDAVRVKSLSSPRPRSYSYLRTTIEDVARDRLARRMFA